MVCVCVCVCVCAVGVGEGFGRGRGEGWQGGVNGDRIGRECIEQRLPCAQPALQVTGHRSIASCGSQLDCLAISLQLLTDAHEPCDRPKIVRSFGDKFAMSTSLQKLSGHESTCWAHARVQIVTEGNWVASMHETNQHTNITTSRFLCPLVACKSRIETGTSGPGFWGGLRINIVKFIITYFLCTKNTKHDATATLIAVHGRVSHRLGRGSMRPINTLKYTDQQIFVPRHCL